MTIAKGDFLRLQRNGKLIEPDEEAYHEFVVLGGIRPENGIRQQVSDFMITNTDIDAEGKHFTYYDIRIRVIR